MSATFISETDRGDHGVSSTPPILKRGTAKATALLIAARRAWRRRRDRHVLAQFDDRALSDIGIGPGEIGHALRLGRSRDSVGRCDDRR